MEPSHILLYEMRSPCPETDRRSRAKRVKWPTCQPTLFAIHKTGCIIHHSTTTTTTTPTPPPPVPPLWAGRERQGLAHDYRSVTALCMATRSLFIPGRRYRCDWNQLIAPPPTPTPPHPHPHTPRGCLSSRLCVCTW